MKKLIELVFLYRKWLYDQYIDLLNIFICREIKNSFSGNSISCYKENIDIYDAACREIALGWTDSKLTNEL